LTKMINPACKRCGSKDLTMLTVAGNQQVPLCAKCTSGWWDLRASVIAETFEAYINNEKTIRSKNSPKG